MVKRGRGGEGGDEGWDGPVGGWEETLKRWNCRQQVRRERVSA